jgi:hypothetical protein
MKIFFVIFLQIVSISCFAAPTVLSRLKFELPATAGSVRGLKIELRKDVSTVTAAVTATLMSKKILNGDFDCNKISINEFDCYADDDHGGFYLIIAPTPRLRFTYFDLSDVTDTSDFPTYSPLPDGALFEISGRKNK